MTANRFFDDLKKVREEWKRDRLNGPYSPDEINYRKLQEKKKIEAASSRDSYVTPELPLTSRFEGMWVVGRQGSGKTQLFKYLLSRDLDLVAAGKASIIVLDPTGVEAPTVDGGGKIVDGGTLIDSLIHLKRFARGGDLYGKLVYINPADAQYALPINLLSLRPNLSDRAAVTSAIASYLSIMGGLMGQPLTNFQDPVFRYAIQVALAFPNPTLETLRNILEVPTVPRGATPPTPFYQSALDRVDPVVARYMCTTYEGQTARGSRGELVNRLASLTADPTFRDIFMASQTTIDFSAEINEPKVIVINASRADLQTTKELYGRYFLALIKRAGESRPANSIPCFIYIDECDEFVANDRNTADIILKLRRKRMALMLGNQVVSRITDSSVRQAFLGTAIKFVNADRDSAVELAENMNLIGENGRPDVSFLVGRPRFNFAYHVQGEMDEPIAFKFKPGTLESEPRMNDDEFDALWEEIRDRYYIPIRRDRGPGADSLVETAPPVYSTNRQRFDGAASRAVDPPGPIDEPHSPASEPDATKDTEGDAEWG